jgi:hypothetical protein
VIGAAIGIALAFLPALRFPSNAYADKAVGKLVAIVCAFAGILVGELAAMAWKDVCH